MPREEVLSAQELPDDLSVETQLRPQSLSDFVGQPTVVEHLDILIKAAVLRRQPADHVLFAGPPGLGKTSLARIVSNEMGAQFRVTSGPTLTRPGDIASMLTALQDGDVLFVDEIHRLSKTVAEVLYPAMEDFQFDVMLGKGPGARSVRLELPRFTLIGATTRTGLLSGPLRDRFGFVARLEHYAGADLTTIVKRAAMVLGVSITEEGSLEIGTRSRGTPRIANRLLRRVRDYAEVRHDGVITGDIARDALVLFGVDHLGLDKQDRQLLQVLCTNYATTPVGVRTLAMALGDEVETVEDVYEPYLVQNGLIARTPQGRVALPKAYHHLGMTPPTVSLVESIGLFGEND
jgi:Holliday junction DNA helicase RuvB